MTTDEILALLTIDEMVTYSPYESIETWDLLHYYEMNDKRKSIVFSGNSIQEVYEKLQSFKYELNAKLDAMTENVDE